MADIANQIMNVIIAIFIFGALALTLADNTVGVAGRGNVTGTSAVITPLIFIFLCLGMMVLVYKAIVKGG